MPKLRIISENKSVEIDIGKIDEKLNSILKDAMHLTSPGYKPTEEHIMDKTTGHLRAGSEVFLPNQYIYQFADTIRGSPQDYITYTFQIVWDENITKHDKDKHWNLRIFRTIHLDTGKKIVDQYDLPRLKGINHIKDVKWLRLEILNDNGGLISSKRFERE